MLLKPWSCQMYSHTDLVAGMALQSSPKQVWLTWVWPCCHIQALEVPLKHWLCEILLAGLLDLQSQLSRRCPGGAGLVQCRAKIAAMRQLWWPAAKRGNMTTSGLVGSVLLRSIAVTLLCVCYLAGLWDSASFPAIYFPWLRLSCSWIE